MIITYIIFKHYTDFELKKQNEKFIYKYNKLYNLERL